MQSDDVKCRKCGAPIFFAYNARGRRVPLDVRPVVMCVPVEPGDMQCQRPERRRFRQLPVYEPHFRTCARADEHVGRAAYAAGDE